MVRPDSALPSLHAGNQRFYEDHASAPHRDEARRIEVSHGQHPKVAVLTCSDSRVVPEFVYDVGLGDIFTVLTAGLATDTAVLGSLEFAVDHLRVNTVVFLAHSACGAVGAATALAATHARTADSKPAPALPESLVQTVAKVDTYLQDPRCAHLTEPAQRDALGAALSTLDGSPVIAQAAADGEIDIAVEVYDLESGQAQPVPGVEQLIADYLPKRLSRRE